MQTESPPLKITPAASPPRAALVVAAALACTALVSACGSSTSSEGTTPKANVDTAKVAVSIEQTILTKRHLKSTVSCPAPMPAAPGNTFECTRSEEHTSELQSP